MRAAAIIALILMAGVPVAAQDQPEQLPEPEVSEQAPIAAAGWCSLRDGEREEDEPGCDAGVAGSLKRWERAALVAAIGSETLGLGGAWVLWRSPRGTTFAVAGGIIAPYDWEEGIDLSRWAPALGATLSFGQRE